MTNEGYVKAKIRALFRKYNVHYHHIPRSGYGNNGAPDYVCNLNRYCEVECKSVKSKKKGEQTELQKENEKKCRASGGTYYLVHEDNFHEFERFVELSMGTENTL